MVKKIAFFRVYTLVPIAKSVAELLDSTFPEYEVEIFTLSKILKRRYDILLINSLFALREYGFSILRNKKVFRRAFISTPFLFKWVKRLVAERISSNLSDYVFSFQLQSLFDTSVPGLPNYVYTDHTHLANLAYDEFNRKDLHSSKWIALERQIYQNATHLFTRSTNISKSLVEIYNVDPDKITCAYVGVNVKTTGGMLENKDYLTKNILFVGVDWERKGGPDLLAAFAQVLEAHPDASLTIVGCQPQVNMPNTKVLGRLPLEDLQKYYQRAVVFCLPTHLEPFGVVFIEAMSYSLPIVATQIGAIPDFVSQGENGYMVDPGDVDGLAKRLIEIIDNPNLIREFGMRSLQLVAERYNWESVGAKIRYRILTDLGQKSSVADSNPLDYQNVHNGQLAEI
jgi:glycosyltransferase involved in cell wall biosynthesis